VTGVANMGNTNTGSPFQFRDNQYATAFNLGKIHGAHNLRFGFEYEKSALNHFQPQGGTFGTARGTFGFAGEPDGVEWRPRGQFQRRARQLLGPVPARLPQPYGKITQFQNPNALRFSTWGLYARDQWQVTRQPDRELWPCVGNTTRSSRTTGTARCGTTWPPTPS